jgi:ankyrin repeat protein
LECGVILTDDFIRALGLYGDPGNIVRLLQLGNLREKIIPSLSDAVRSNDIEAVRDALRDGADPAARDNAALIIASAVASAEVIKLLIDAGADATARDNKALLNAAKRNSTDAVRILLEAGACATADGDQSMNYAIENINFDIILLLIKHGQEINDFEDYTLTYAAEISESVELLEFLIQHGADPAVDNCRPLRHAVLEGNLTTSALLLSKLPDIDILNLIEYAVGSRKLEAVKFIIDAGADVTIRNNHAVRKAHIDENPEIIQLLVDACSNHPRYRYAHDSNTHALYIFDAAGIDYSNIPDCNSLYGASIWCSDRTLISHEFIRRTIQRKKSAYSA